MRLVHGGHEVLPDLPEDHRQREHDPEVDGDPERGQERLGGREGEQRLALVLEHVVGDVLHEPADDVRVQHVADDAADGDGAEADEQPLAQLVQVLDERGLLAVVEPARHARARQAQREDAAAGTGQRGRAERAARRAGRLLRGRPLGGEPLLEAEQVVEQAVLESGQVVHATSSISRFRVAGRRERGLERAPCARQAHAGMRSG